MNKLKNFLVKDEGFTHYEQQYLLDTAVAAGAELYDYRACTRHPHVVGGFSLNWNYFGVVEGKTFFCDHPSHEHLGFANLVDDPDEIEVLGYQDALDYLWDMVKEPEEEEPMYKFDVGDTVKIYEGVHGVEYCDDHKRYFGEVGTVRTVFTNLNGYHVYTVEFASGGSITIIEECLQEHKVYVIDAVRAQSYYVDCPKCGSVSDDNLDPRGRGLDCPGCGSTLEVPYYVNLEWCCG